MPSSTDPPHFSAVRGNAFLFREVEDDTDGYRLDTSASIAFQRAAPS